MTTRIVHLDRRIELRIVGDTGYRVFELSELELRSLYRDAHNIIMELADGLHQTPQRDHRTVEEQKG